MKKELILVFIGVFLIGNVCAFSLTGWFARDVVEIEEVDVGYDNFVGAFGDNVVLMDMPRGARVNVYFYNEEGVVRGYCVDGRSILDGELDDVDFAVSINEKYLGGLTTVNYCSVLAELVNAGDFSYELNISKLGLFWKYRGLFKYRYCLGV